MKGNVLILGAGSGIARSLATELARRGYGLVLAARDETDAAATAQDLGVRFGASAVGLAFDALDVAGHDTFLDAASRALPGGIHGVVLAYAVMPDQAEMQRNPALLKQMLETNVVSTFAILENVAARLEKARGGFICAFSSVAGDRGRQSLYLYGATKAALTTYLAGLRNRLHPAGVRVVTVKPGFIDTGMTWRLKAPGPLASSPERVARDVAEAIESGKPVVYTPWFWRWVMLVIRLIPERLFVRMKL